ncbi:MAG: isoprenylcysteine carboxylmethyltransferase family protein [Xanthobacteraceae bacterium]|nr:isoprenylcysteine carboxylmethyltransferase family protein [Xanthobacteraceae bacterium]
MLLKDMMSKHGSFLFRGRSYLPLALTPLLAAAVLQPAALDHWISRRAELIWEFGSLAIAFVGILVRVLTTGFVPAGTSGRNTSSQIAESLNTTGFYSVTRNPLYLGNFMVMLGIALATKAWCVVLIAAIAFALYYERIIFAEESFLEAKFGEDYRRWAGSTPVFFPNFRLWQAPLRTFSIRTVLRREFHGVYLVVVIFTLVELGHDLTEGASLSGWIDGDFAWAAFFWTGTLFYLILVFLKKRTKLLEAAGR